MADTRRSRREFLRAAGATGAVAATGAAAVSGRGRAADAEEVGVGWQFKTGGVVSSSYPSNDLAVANGTVYVGTQSGKLHAVEIGDGSKAWTFDTSGFLGGGSPIRGSVGVGGGTVFVPTGSPDNELVAVSEAGGERRWGFTVAQNLWLVEDQPILSDVTVAGGSVYFGAEDGGFYALAMGDGELEWRFGTGEVRSTPVVGENGIYVGSDGGLWGLKPTYDLNADKSERWHVDAGSVRGGPALVDGTVYASSDDGVLYAVNAADGTVMWRHEAGNAIGTTPAVADGTVFAGTDNGSLFAISTTDGSQEWTAAVGDGVGGGVSVANGRVYVGGEDGSVYAFSTGRGEQRWRFETGGPVRTRPVVVNGTVIVGTQDSHVYALEPGQAQSQLPVSPIAGAVGGAGVLGTILLARSRGIPPFQANDGSESDIGSGSATGSSSTSSSGRSSSDSKAADVPSGSQESAGSSTDQDSSITRFNETSGPTATEPESGSSTGHVAESVASSRGDDEDGADLGSIGSDSVAGSDWQSNVTDDIPGGPDLEITFEDIEDRELVGSGGSADVYRGSFRGHDVALKLPSFEGTLHADTLERFTDEAETWAKLDDGDHVVDLLGWDSTPRPWLAMEYMDGGTLADRVGDLPAAQALWTAAKTADGVYHAHRFGVAHLDLKPENVLFRETEGWPAPKVADWGLARLLIERSRSVEGFTPGYAAPEQFAPEEYGDPDTQTDVYGLAATCYELLTGQPPFTGNRSSVMYDVLESDPDPPTAVDPSLPDGLDELLLTGLAKDRDERYDSVVYLRDGFEKLLDPEGSLR